jgi:cation:H+ antiporter
MTVGLLFLASAMVLLVAGTLLAKAADTIAERTGIGRVWVGTVLLAAATSLPELASDVAAVSQGNPDLAAGDLFGSSMANMLVLALLDLSAPRRRVLRRSSVQHAMSASLAIILTAIAGAALLFPQHPSTPGVGLFSGLLVAVYLSGAYFAWSRRPRESEAGAPHPRGLVRPAVSFAAAATAIAVAAPTFASSAARLAAITGAGQTFLGSWLLGFTTSAPELIASLAAVRMGAFDLAVGNLFGSNALNMALFAALDLANGGKPLFAVLDPVHALTALLAILLTAIGLSAVLERGERRSLPVDPAALAILVAYLVGIALLFGATRPG